MSDKKYDSYVMKKLPDGWNYTAQWLNYDVNSPEKLKEVISDYHKHVFPRKR